MTARSWNYFPDGRSIVIYNKTDLEAAVDIEELKEKTGSPVIPVSVVEKPESVS